MRRSLVIHWSPTIPEQSAAGHAPEAPFSTHQGRGARLAPYHISKLACSQLAVHIMPSLEHKLKNPSQLELCNLLAQRWQAGMVRRWTGKPQMGPPPGPVPSKGIQKSMMEFVSTGTVLGA
eukprot:1061218-Pelagomonas_calceolata.AAC.1